MFNYALTDETDDEEWIRMPHMIMITGMVAGYTAQMVELFIQVDESSTLKSHLK
jgi:hypothetical protein